MAGFGKADVKEFWQSASCGEIYAQGADTVARLDEQARERYRLEPYIVPFARFHEAAGKKVLEIGVGMGADHSRFALARPKQLIGIDLTERALNWTQERLLAQSTVGRLVQADAEALPLPSDYFDLVYSWGVLHHSPDTRKAVAEVHRVLRPGGTARLMLYHRFSMVGGMLWLRYGAVRGMGLRKTYSRFLESPGTQAFSVRELEDMFGSFSGADVRVLLGVGDLLDGRAGERYDSRFLRWMRACWPRWAIKRWLSRFGLIALVSATK